MFLIISMKIGIYPSIYLTLGVEYLDLYLTRAGHTDFGTGGLRGDKGPMGGIDKIKGTKISDNL